jgi:hypothetical protein
VAKTAVAAGCCFQDLNLYSSAHLDPVHADLGDTVAAPDREWLGPMVDQDYTDLASIVGVNSTRRIQHCHSLLQRQAASASHLDLEAGRHGHGKARLHEHAITRLNYGIHIGTYIKTARVGGSANWQTSGRRKAFDVQLHTAKMIPSY